MLVKKMFAFAFLLCFSIAGSIAQGIVVKNNSKSKTIAFGNQKLKLILNYSGKAAITALEVNGQKVIDAAAGIYSEVRTAKATYSSNRTVSPPNSFIKC